MGSHFDDWIDYKEVVFSPELLEWVAQFRDFGGKNIPNVGMVKISFAQK